MSLSAFAFVVSDADDLKEGGVIQYTDFTISIVCTDVFGSAGYATNIKREHWLSLHQSGC